MVFRAVPSVAAVFSSECFLLRMTGSLYIRPASHSRKKCCESDQAAVFLKHQALLDEMDKAVRSRDMHKRPK